jgi:hypothetical protein
MPFGFGTDQTLPPQREAIEDTAVEESVVASTEVVASAVSADSAALCGNTNKVNACSKLIGSFEAQTECRVCGDNTLSKIFKQCTRLNLRFEVKADLRSLYDEKTVYLTSPPDFSLVVIVLRPMPFRKEYEVQPSRLQA